MQMALPAPDIMLLGCDQVTPKVSEQRTKPKASSNLKLK